MTSIVELKGIDKSYGGLKALRNVDFQIKGGEIHALLGENGAGKSTLMRVLGGETIPDAGTIVIGGRIVSFRDPRAARTEGIALIHQELALAPDLTVAENIFLGELPAIISWKKLNQKAGDLINRLGVDINPSVVTAKSLSLTNQPPFWPRKMRLDCTALSGSCARTAWALSIFPTALRKSSILQIR